MLKGPGCEGGRPVQDYCFRNVKEFMSREFGAQVEAPATPDRTVEVSIVLHCLEDEGLWWV